MPEPGSVDTLMIGIALSLGGSGYSRASSSKGEFDMSKAIHKIVYLAAILSRSTRVTHRSLHAGGNPQQKSCTIRKTEPPIVSGV